MSYRNPVRAVGVVGTVQVEGGTGGGGGGTTPATGRRADSTSFKTNSPMTVITPSDCAANDLLILAVSRFDTSGNGSFTPQEAGWTEIPTGSNGSHAPRVFYRVATADDAGGKKTYSFSISPATNQTGVAPILVLTAVAGFTTVGTRNQVTTPESSGTNYTNTLTFPSVAAPGMACIVITGRPNIDKPTWMATPDGPPGSPQPVWTGAFYKGADEQLQCGIFTSPITWTPEGAYKATVISRNQSCYLHYFPIK